jgi:hypothetical protein
VNQPTTTTPEPFNRIDQLRQSIDQLFILRRPFIASYNGSDTGYSIWKASPDGITWNALLSADMTLLGQLLAEVNV